MANTSKSVYDPEILSKTSLLSIRARQLVEGYLSGQHKSRHKGSSVEFAEYKDYTPGDETKYIDWKLVGKTDKYHVKQFEQSTNLKCTIFLDTSGSMGYLSPQRKPGVMNKVEYAQTLVAALSYIILHQFDGVGLLLFNDRVNKYIPPRYKPSHFQHILHGLETLKNHGVTRISNVVNNTIEGLPDHGMVMIISDLLIRDDDLYKSLKLMRSRGLEVIVFHVLHPDEVHLPFEGDIVFESLEDDPNVNLDPADIRNVYKKIIQENIKTNRKIFPSLGIDYLFLETSNPLDQVLNYYLLKRKSLYKG